MLSIADAFPGVVATPEGCVPPQVFVTRVWERLAVQVVVLH